METSVDLLLTISSLLLSVASLVATILAFAASVVFYVRGTKLQDQSVRLLTVVSEISRHIDNSLNGMLDKTLDAALGGSTVQDALVALNDKVARLDNYVASRGSNSGESVDGQEDVDDLSSEIDELRGSIRELSTSVVKRSEPGRANLYSRVELEIIRALSESRRGLSEQQIFDVVNKGLPGANFDFVSRALNMLLYKGLVRRLASAINDEHVNYQLAG